MAVGAGLNRADARASVTGIRPERHATGHCEWVDFDKSSRIICFLLANHRIL
jgi:hypothetical protein